jgi:hypothetical protein
MILTLGTLECGGVREQQGFGADGRAVELLLGEQNVRHRVIEPLLRGLFAVEEDAVTSRSNC